MSTVLRSVPVRRFHISNNGSIAPMTSNQADTENEHRPNTPHIFRSLSSVPPSNVLKEDLKTTSSSAASSTTSIPAANETQQGGTESNAAAAENAEQNNENANVANNNAIMQPPSASTSPARSTTNASQQQQQPPTINLDNFEAMPPMRGVINSPRSLRVCTEMKIHPTELVQRPLNDFLAHGVPRSVAILRRDHFEKQRQEKLITLRQARDTMPETEAAEAIALYQAHQNVQQHNTAAIDRLVAGDSSVPRFSKRGTTSTTTMPPPAASSSSISRNNTNNNGYERSASNISSSARQQQQQQRSGSVNSNNNNINNNKQRNTITPLRRTTTPLSRSATPFSRSGTGYGNSYNEGVTSPARDNHLRKAQQQENHRAEIAQRAKMEQTTKELTGVQKIAHNDRQREMTMRKILRDRLMDSEKKRLELEDHQQHAQRQRRLREMGQERMRQISIRRKQEQVPQRDAYLVAEAKLMYSSPKARKEMAVNDIRAAPVIESPQQGAEKMAFH